MAGTGPPLLDGTALTLRSAKSCGGGPLSGPGSRFLRRHPPGIGPGQLDASGQTIDTGRELERPPHPHPHHVTSCQRGARKPGGRGGRRTFWTRDLYPCAVGDRGRFDGRGVVGEGAGPGRPRELLLSHVTPLLCAEKQRCGYAAWHVTGCHTLNAEGVCGGERGWSTRRCHGNLANQLSTLGSRPSLSASSISLHVSMWAGGRGASGRSWCQRWCCNISTPPPWGNIRICVFLVLIHSTKFY